ncbi:MAG TPA: DUF3606 domain-containing protein [Bacteriovoracaceae bacterium]|nr:DUF3606 domain-containing protein [Bacteriovoracaceae bacterium]
MAKIKVLSNDSGGLSPGTYYSSSEAVVDIDNQESLEKWSKNLGISIKELKDAIEKYGIVVREIRKGLLKSKSA